MSQNLSFTRRTNQEPPGHIQLKGADNAKDNEQKWEDNVISVLHLKTLTRGTP